MASIDKYEIEDLVLSRLKGIDIDDVLVHHGVVNITMSTSIKIEIKEQSTLEDIADDITFDFLSKMEQQINQVKKNRWNALTLK